MKNYYIVTVNLEVYSRWDQIVIRCGNALELPAGVKLPYSPYIKEATNVDRLLIMGEKISVTKIIPPINYIKVLINSFQNSLL
jgi:hypothetical protein